MCGRFGLVGNENELQQQFGVKKTPDLFPSYNIAPSRSVLGIGRFAEDGRAARHFRWGLIPSWAKDEQIGYRLINARGETVMEKPSFRSAFARRRLIVPASYFFEWKHEGSKKIPYLIRLKGHGLFGMAGLWERWTAPTGEVIDSCAIITCEANETVSALHDRMPVILPEERYGLWLGEEYAESNDMASLLRPFSADGMDLYPVTGKVGNPRFNTPECMEPLAV
jgi:putative SOS response-associated peptidase YedK